MLPMTARLFQNRPRLRSSFAAAMVLPLAISAALAASPQEMPQRGAEVRVAPSQSGHYVVAALINGTPLSLIVDTGASQVVLSYEDALRVGLKLEARDFTQVAETANGVTHFAPVLLSGIAVGPLQRGKVQALVAEKGRLSSSLLGMTFLSQLSKVGTREGVLVLSD